MKRVLLTIFIVITTTCGIHAQFNPRNLTFGGGLGLQFGDYTLVNIAPQVGYNFGNYFNLGAGISYSYFGEKFDNDRYKQTNNYLGINAYARFYPIQYVVLMVQPEISRMWKSVENRSTHTKTTTDKMIPSCLVGAGVRFGPITAMLKYDLAQNSDSPFGTRIFYSLGYTFGF